MIKNIVLCILLLGVPIFSAHADKSCEVTPAVYHLDALPIFYTSNNMSRIKGTFGRAIGTPLLIHGWVYDSKCIPISEVSVELWHKNANGVFNFDEAHFELWDKHFTGTGTAATDNWGYFLFQTIFPGTMAKGEMPALYLRVRHPDFPILETKFFFEDFYNGRDILLKSLTNAQKYRLIAEKMENDQDFLEYKISIVMSGESHYKTN